MNILYVDDLRRADLWEETENTILYARTLDKAFQWLNEFGLTWFDEIWLDYDLDAFEKEPINSEPFANQLVMDAKGVRRGDLPLIRIVSANADGAKALTATLSPLFRVEVEKLPIWLTKPDVEALKQEHSRYKKVIGEATKE